MKPISFTEFDGGITDKDVPGRPNRFSVCDNFLIDYDKKLLQRDGFDIYSSTAYQLAAAERVSRLANFDNDSEVLAFQNKKAFAISGGAWTEVVGPGGGSATTKAFNTNTAASLLEETQWQHHLYASTDSGDPVVKMFRDSGNTMRLRTAGLPEWTESLTPTDGGLALAIALANDLRTQMIAHFGSNAVLSPGTPSNTATTHHYTNAALTTQASAVTASVAATTLGTLITLLNVLRTQYGSHIGDAQLQDFTPSPGTTGYNYTRLYHMTTYGGGGNPGYYPYSASAPANTPAYLFQHYLNFSLEDANFTIPSGSVIADVLPYLNDLRDKWNWHTYAPMTHYNAAYWLGNNYFTYLGSHATALARVEPYSWAQIAPNYGPFIQFVKDFKTEYDAHRLNDMHMEDDTIWVVPSGVSSAPTDFWGTIALLGWLTHAFTYHALEADTTFCKNAFFQDTCSYTNASPSITFTGGTTTDRYKDYRLLPMPGKLSSPYAWELYVDFDYTKSYYVTANNNSTPGTMTMSNNMTGTQGGGGAQLVFTTRHFHYGPAASQLFSPKTFCSDWDDLDFFLGSAASLQGFADLAKTLAGYLRTHTLAKVTAVPATANTPLLVNGQKYDNYYNTLATLAATGDSLLVHAPQDQVNYPISAVGPGGIYLPLNSALLSANTPATQMDQSRFLTAPTAASFNYKGVFKYDYTVGTKSFTDRSAPSVAINAIGFINEDSGGKTETGKFAASLTNIYAFANAANENFAHTDTTNFRKEFYRTLANGTRYYKVDVNGTGGDITNATTTLSDYSSDTYLVDQLELYTNGGTPENNRPPAATNIHVFGNVMYYVLGNKVYQSIPNDPDSVPDDFFEEFEENVVAVSSTRSVAVAFSANKVFRLIGGFDDLGRGSLTYDRIFDRTGAISAQSVVKADNGIFFAGKDGFYFTDGYQCMRVTDLEKTFRTYTDSAAKRNRIQGVYDNISKRVYWTVQTGSSSYPDKIWVLDLQFGIKPDSTPVTTLSKTSGFNPTALTYFNGQLYYGDNDGYVYVQTRGRNYDLVKDTAVAATAWAVETTQWDLKSCHYNYGTDALRKAFTRTNVEFDMQSTNVSCQIVSDVDKGRITSNLPVIRSRKLTDWGDSKLDWISSVYPAKAGNIVDEWRWFKGDGSLRSNYRALEFKTAYCVIVASKDMGTVTIANVAGNVYTATLTSLLATRKWPLYSVGYFVRINSVDYPLTVRTSDSVVRIDATGLTAPSTGVPDSWELWGYPKNERARLFSYSVAVDLEDEQQTHSEGPVTTGGQNA